MRTYILLAITLFFSNIAHSQTINNATINMTGNMQNVIVSQTGAGHSVNLSLFGDNIPVMITQSGSTPQSFNLSITCYSNCASNPTVVNQY